jgi:sulfur carrier protein ThiS
MLLEVELLVPYNRIVNVRNISIEIQGNTLDKLISALVTRIPALGNHMTGEEIPGASPFLLLINGKIIPIEKQSEVFLQERDHVAFTRIVAGG